jgi:hypothetical protein
MIPTPLNLITMKIRKSVFVLVLKLVIFMVAYIDGGDSSIHSCVRGKNCCGDSMMFGVVIAVVAS